MAKLDDDGFVAHCRSWTVEAGLAAAIVVAVDGGHRLNGRGRLLPVPREVIVRLVVVVIVADSAPGLGRHINELDRSPSAFALITLHQSLVVALLGPLLQDFGHNGGGHIIGCTVAVGLYSVRLRCRGLGYFVD